MVAFDTLKASRRLRDAGFEEEKTEALVNAFAQDIGANLATKDDIALLRQEMAGEFSAARKDMANEIASVRKDMALLEQRVNNRILLAVGSATTVLLAALGIVAGIIVSRL